MSGQLVIEPAKFARLGSTLTGTLEVVAMQRLRAELANDSGAVTYRVRGFINDQGAPALEVDVAADLELSCQRCLNVVEQHVGSHRTLVFLADADEFAPMTDEDEGEDIMPAVQRLDLAEVIEDEMLLSLPLSAHHPDGQCEVAAGVDDVTGEQERTERSAFAALGALKRRNDAR